MASKDNQLLKPYKISTSGADMTLELLSQKLEKGDIEIPEFQRNHIWLPSRSSKLIESFMLGLPVPQIFLYREPKTHKLLVVDGQQRLTAIHAFFKDAYQDKPFRLTDLKSEWDGMSYEDFSDADKRKFKNTTLRATIFEQTDPKDNTSVFEVFERLNTGGVSLSAQEVRNAVVGGKIKQLLDELNQDENWRTLWGNDHKDKRMRDIELILRFFALHDGWKTYKKPMNTFLTDYMATKKQLTEKEYFKMEDIFKKTTKIINEKISPNAFRLKKSLNAALADSVMVGVAKNLNNTSKLNSKYLKLINNNEYLESIEQHTTDTDKIQLRTGLAIKIFKK
jgi:uncharacterized protein with ParB-like and HNH nuclease domain